MTNNETTDRVNKGRTPKDYEALRFTASVMYIKEGLSQKQIVKQLFVAEPTLINWRKAGKWDALRPDLEVLKQYKAASLYIDKKETPAEISMKLSVSETTVKMWIYLNGWDAARMVAQSHDMVSDFVADFCKYVNRYFPKDAAKMEMMQNSYLKTLKPIK
jgi:uncharacterized protein YjcR